MLQEPVAADIGAIDTLEERSVPFSRESAGVRTARWRERGGVAKRQGRGLQNPDSPVRIRAPPPPFSCPFRSEFYGGGGPARLDTAHFKGHAWTGSGLQSFKLQRRRFAAGLKPQYCEECGWSRRTPDGRLPLEVHHINGDPAHYRGGIGRHLNNAQVAKQANARHLKCRPADAGCGFDSHPGHHQIPVPHLGSPHTGGHLPLRR